MKPKRLLALVLSLAMIMGALPTFSLSVFAVETATEKNITLGTSVIKCENKSNVYFGTYQQSSLGSTQPTTGTENVDWVYSSTAINKSQGSYYKKEPIKWRVRDTAFDYDNNATDGTTDTTTSALLLFDKNLDVVKCYEDQEAVSWVTSTMRSWLNGYEASSAKCTAYAKLPSAA